MPSFEIYHLASVSHIETIEAESPAAAADAAQEGGVSLCHQCNRAWEPDGDSEMLSITDSDGLRWVQDETGEWVPDV